MSLKRAQPQVSASPNAASRTAIGDSDKFVADAEQGAPQTDSVEKVRTTRGSFDFVFAGTASILLWITIISLANWLI